LATTTKQRLVILPGYCEPVVLKSILPDSQVLALTPMAMSLAEALQVPFSTPDEFYKVEEFRQELTDLNGKTEDLFRDLDRLCLDSLDFPLAYSATIYWFQVIFADLLYLSRLSDRIGQRYGKISLICPFQEMGWEKLGYRDLERPVVTHALENKIKLLPHIMQAECLDPGSQEPRVIPLAIRTISRMKRAPGALRRRISEKSVQVSHRCTRALIRKQPCIFVIHSGFELHNLRSKFSDYMWVDPIARLNEHISALKPLEYDFEAIGKRLRPFLNSTFLGFSQQLEALFLRFHLEVIGRLALWRAHLEEMLRTLKPQALFFSVSANTVPAALISYIANKSALPIFNFQHGGASVFTRHPYQKYLEMNESINKILILNAKAEEQQAQHQGSECRVFGSSARYRLLKSEPRTKKRRVLYCCGIMPYFSYKGLFFNVSDFEYFKASREILRAADENSLSIDIKLHPSGEKYGYHYFHDVIKLRYYANARILSGIPAESIIASYGLIVLEYLNSSVAATALGLKIPVVLYLKDLSFVHEHVLRDLEQRCHIVRDYASLYRVFGMYHHGGLATKWSEHFVDQYLYPVQQGDPSRVISHYVRQVIDKGNPYSGDEFSGESRFHAYRQK
jgi:hypothetical protein